MYTKFYKIFDTLYQNYKIFLESSVSHLLPLRKSFSLLYYNSSCVSVENSKFAPSTIASTGHASWQKPQ